MRVLCSLQKNEEHVATLNGIPMKMYEQAHFTLEEWAALHLLHTRTVDLCLLFHFMSVFKLTL